MITMIILNRFIVYVIIQSRDEGQGINVDSIKALGVLGYVDDLTMMEYTIESMTTRLTNFADAANEDADMKVKMKKTYSQLVCEQEPVGAPHRPPQS